jgi:hypothetical protein
MYPFAIVLANSRIPIRIHTNQSKSYLLILNKLLMHKYEIFGSITSEEVKCLIQSAIHWVGRNVEAKEKGGVIYLKLSDVRLTGYFNKRVVLVPISDKYPENDGTIIYPC